MNFNRFLLLLIFALCFFSLHAQELKEFNIKPVDPPASIPIFRNYPDDAAIIVYSSIEGVAFESNTGGIVNISNDISKYTIVVKTEKQFLTLKLRGYKEGRIQVPLLKPRETRYYEVTTKGSGQEKIPVTIITDPPEAEIYIDGTFMGIKETHEVEAGIRRLVLKKEGYFDLDTTVQIDRQKTLFKPILKKQVDLKLEIRTEPQGAYILIDGKPQGGETDISLFKPAGEYSLKLSKPGYLDTSVIISVKPNDENSFFYRLIKNEAILEVKVNPADAQFTINNESREPGVLTPPPGLYILEISKTGYLKQSDTLNLLLGTKTVKSYSLVKNAATIAITVEPADAEIKIDQVKRNAGEIEVTPGARIVEVTKNGYVSILDTIALKVGDIARKSYNLEKNTGTLRLGSNLQGFTFYLNDKAVPFAPSFELLSGSHSVRAVKEGYYEFRENVIITRGREFNLQINLKARVGSVQFSVSPLNTRINLVRNERAEYSFTGAVQNDSIMAGSYRLVASAEGYEEYSENLNITENTRTERTINLKRKLTAAELERLQGGRLFISVDPPEAEVKLYRGSKLLSTWRGARIDSLAKGSYEVEARLEGYEVFEDEVDVNTGKLTELEIKMKKIDLTKAAEPKWYKQWYYYAAGAVVTGGIAAYILLRNGDDKQAREAIVDPPGRP